MGAIGTAMRPAFAAQMKRLLGLKFAPSNLTTHWEALSDIPDDLLAEAVTRAAKDCIDFPAPKELRSFADQVRARASAVAVEEDRGVELIAPVVLGTLPTGTVIKAKREWRYYCEDCSDSGWRSIWCGERFVMLEDGKTKRELAMPWMESGHCGRRGEHGAHEFVAPCPCASSNPDIVRRKERMAHAGTKGQE